MDYHFFGAWQTQTSTDQKIIEEAIAFVHNVIHGFNQNRSVSCIVSTVVAPFLSVQYQSLINEFNAALRVALRHTPHYVFDVEALAQIVGLENWHQPVQYYLAKLAFSPSLIPLITDKLARFIASLEVSPKKCIVLDLDNTLWGWGGW